jgi:hypothetical protein
MQSELAFDRPRPGDLFKYGSQNYRLYQRLLLGPVENIEVVHKMNILNSTGRSADIRRAVKPYLMDVVATPVKGREGVWEYRLKG